MLSFIYRVSTDFTREHGFRPNVIYINPEHLRRLREQFSEATDLAAIKRLLDMEIVVRTDAAHPHVGWSQAATRQAS